MPGKSAYRPRPRRYVKKVRQNRQKKLLTGQEPTLVEKIASGVGSVAKLAQAVLPAIAAINTESKYYDETASFTSYGTSTNADLRCITDSISAGTSDNNRIGNSVLARDLQLRCAFSMPMSVNANPAVTGGHHRLIIFAWKYNDSAGPTISKILESPSNIYSPVNKNFSDQFVILKDKHMQFNATCGTTSVGTVQTMDFKSIKLYKKLEWHLRWDDAGQAVANHIYLLSISTPSSVNNAINTTFYSRLNFTDN